jgi:hypothetical protein
MGDHGIELFPDNDHDKVSSSYYKLEACIEIIAPVPDCSKERDEGSSDP